MVVEVRLVNEIRLEGEKESLFYFGSFYWVIF